jgi:Icc-related predicted phosphoesterase
MEELKEIAKEVDAIFLCGDLFGKDYEFNTVLDLAKQQKADYLYMLDVFKEIEAGGVKCRYILGNDDWFEDVNDDYHLAEMEKIAGIEFHPFPYVGITPFHSNNECEEIELEEKLDLIKVSQDSIIVGHMVPENCGDSLYDGSHVGSEVYRQWIEENQPLFVLSGHIHECSLETNEIGDTVILNCASEYESDTLKGFIIDTKSLDVDAVGDLF